MFTKYASAFALLFLALFGVVLASPVSVKRDNTDILAVLQTLNSSLADPLAQITSMGKAGNATILTAEPLITEIETHLTTAAASFAALKATSPLSRRQSSADVASLAAGIVSGVTNAVSTLGATSSTSLVGGLLPGLDTALDAVLSGLETLLAGVLNLVATLLVDVAGLLQNLALGLTLGSLGL